MNPTLDKYKFLSAITNPTVKKIFDDGKNGITVKAMHNNTVLKRDITEIQKTF